MHYEKYKSLRLHVIETETYFRSSEVRISEIKEDMISEHKHCLLARV